MPTRSELQEELAEVDRYRAAVSDVLRVIANSPDDLQPVFDAILDSATDLCQANVGALFLLRNESVYVVAQRGPAASALHLPEGPEHQIPPESPLGRLIRDSAPIHIGNLTEDQSYSRRETGTVAAVELAGGRTCLLVPMLKEDELIGTIGVLRPEVRPFTDRQLKLIVDFAAQAAIALEITRREAKYREVQIELAHGDRLAAPGQLTAAITHELKQPLAAVVKSANASLRWLTTDPPDVEEAKRCVERILTDADRAGEVISRIHSLMRKAGFTAS
ncbi:GAF domain-containing protein [Microvirga sp. KLBC 81]|uniref:GAF domain-containing protein n=1 Tax=Microvirga sp. KLBC 81 TaxID=1862707 RepID=UPI001401EAAA|nr:GAF domain-containing protein [Microvirga sp. KLBC 81]